MRCCLFGFDSVIYCLGFFAMWKLEIIDALRHLVYVLLSSFHLVTEEIFDRTVIDGMIVCFGFDSVSLALVS